MWVHHGASGDSTLRTLQAYERYHVGVLGWRAPGWSFAVCYEGSEAVVYEIRGWGHTGAHTAGDNHDSHGVVLVGDWTSGSVPGPMVHALAWLACHAGEEGYGPREVTGGHRQAPGAETDCPGDAGMRAVRRARELVNSAEPSVAPPEPPPKLARNVEDSDEEADMLVDVVEVGEELYLIHHPFRLQVPADHHDYYRDLAGPEGDRRYDGPWKWTRDRLEKHPKMPWTP
jgi:hypothetical protein